VKLGLYRSAV